MKNLVLNSDLNIFGLLKEGYVDLFDRGGNHYRHKALFVPRYGFVPCSRRLMADYTNDSKFLSIVINDQNDIDPPFCSDIWITRSSLATAVIVDLEDYRSDEKGINLEKNSSKISANFKPNTKSADTSIDEDPIVEEFERNHADILEEKRWAFTDFVREYCFINDGKCKMKIGYEYNPYKGGGDKACYILGKDNNTIAAFINEEVTLEDIRNNIKKLEMVQMKSGLYHLYVSSNSTQAEQPASVAQ